MTINSVETFIDKLRVFLAIGLCVIALSSLIQTSKPFHLRQLAAWRIECELGIVSDPECPVDGGWSAWAAWSACRGPCDAAGRRRRARRCDNPPPSDDGLPCSGADEETEPCYRTDCTVDRFRVVVEGDGARMQALRELETVPALMDRCLRRECGYSSIEAALASDNTWQIDPEAFWNSLQCVKHNLGCPVVGEWGGWEAWTACSARCGRGERRRVRRCDTPPPSAARLRCVGAPLQADDCEGDRCAPATDAAAAAGHWSEWGAWSPCTERCGPGVRRRRRTCLERPVTRSAARWGTHCVGRYDEFQVCESDECDLDGGWSGWGSWGPCSQTCGAGKQFRTRSCTRPTPAGNGRNCVGSKTEFGACYRNPCDAYTHVVVVLDGDSYLHYNFKKKRSALFHFYVRFLPLSPHGTLVRRGPVHDPHVRLSLQKWHVCLDARGSSSCIVPRTCSPAVVEPAVWHSALITVSNEAATLRLDDALVPIKAVFPCDPDLPNAKMNILIGERLHGEIQEMVLNFVPLRLTQREQRSSQEDFSPSSSSNVAYEKASIEEAYLPLHDDQYLRLPCFDTQNEWRLELTIKPKRDSGTILFLKDDLSDSWLLMELQNMRLKLKLVVGEFRAESSSTAECPPDQWLDIMLNKKKETNTIEASLNGGERLHVVLEDEIARKRRELETKIVLLISETTCFGPKERIVSPRELKSVSFSICNDEFFVGGTPAEIGDKIRDDLTPFSGIIASISINNILQDLHACNIERNKRDRVQLSSRTASVSGSYHETAWGPSNLLSLTCVHARSARSPHTAQWLYLDTTVAAVMKRKPVRALDDGKVLKLVASADNDLRGFYTCRAHTHKRTVNVVTYGVTGKVKYNLSRPDTTTAIAVITTVLLVVATLGWLIVEGIYDLRTGFGFFRDAHLTAEQEAEAVCGYIDDHAHLVGSAGAVRRAKSRARYRAKRLALASSSSFAAQEIEGLLRIRNQTIEENSSFPDADDSMLSDLDLPELPETRSGKSPALGHRSAVAQHVAQHSVYRCSPSYISSPRHGSPPSPRPRLTSSSSADPSSPRFLCNRLLLPRKINTSRQSLWSKKRRAAFNRNFDIPRKMKNNLLTIKSSTFEVGLALSPAQVLQKFQQLRCDD